MQLNALFCSLWCNIEASCHKHFRRLLLQFRKTPPLTTSDVSQLAVCWPCSTSDSVDNTWLVAAFTARTKARYRVDSESRFLPTPPAFNVPPRKGGFRQNIATPFGTEKLEWCGYQMVKKFRRHVYSFDMIHERDRHTDRQTDGRTDRHRMTA